MKIQSQDHLKGEFKNNDAIEKQSLTCKDGFCSIPDSNQSEKSNLENINIFDPIQ